jgi:hypothetical protein
MAGSVAVQGRSMTNTISIWLAILIIGFFAVDYFFLGWDTPVFLGRKLGDLIEWMAFWR